jgi:hypothetical protein
MSDDLVKRLRTARNFSDIVGHLKAAADRIEGLEREQKSIAAKEFVEVAGSVDRLITTARREALEEAARVAEASTPTHPHTNIGGGMKIAGQHIAAAIRKLKEKE